MVNYVCRTCLYVCDNEYSFRRLERVKGVLELFVPEIKTFVGKYSLICDQCYYFLKNVEKFKTKCIETQKKLYSMNVEAIKDSQDAILQTASNNMPLRGQPLGEIQSQYSIDSKFQPIIKRSAEDNLGRVCKQSKQDPSITITSTVTSENDITLASLLQTAAKPGFPLENQAANQKNETALNLSVADDLLHLFDNDVNDLKGFREFAVKNVTSNKELKETHISDAAGSNDSNETLVLNYAEDEEYMTKGDLVSAGILSGSESESSSEPDIIEIDISDSGGSSGETVERVELKISGGNKSDISNEKNINTTPFKVSINESKLVPTHTIINNKKNTNTTPLKVSVDESQLEPTPITAIIKKEITEDENPGFFNKQSTDGYYKCRLCEKQYKTSKGLYTHTKKLHAAEVKLHHCNYCSFFTLWKSALLRHYNIFHTEVFESSSPQLKCHICSFKTSSNDQLCGHIKDSHVYETFMRCSMCRSRFSNSISLTKHVKKHHSIQKSDRCISCDKLISSKDYEKHLKTHAHELNGKQNRSVINLFCPICSKLFDSQDEYEEHQFKVHKTSFT